MLTSKFGPVKIFHIRDFVGLNAVDNHGGITYAFAKVDDSNWVFATAKCSWKDNFCRRVGRNIAIGRLNAGIYQNWEGEEPDYEAVENHATFENPMLQSVFEDMGSLLFNER